MANSDYRIVAVIMVGGPTKGTRFRPLSLNIPKSLFPLAGQPMVHHPISACKRIPNLAQIYLVGFYEEREFALYVSSISNELIVPVRYLRENKPHGSAGGLYVFRDIIMEDKAHRRYGGMGTILVSKVATCQLSCRNTGTGTGTGTENNNSLKFKSGFGCWDIPKYPNRFLQSMLVSSVNWLLILLPMRSCITLRSQKPLSLPSDFVRLDQDILTPLAGKKQLYTYETLDFWEQIKTPGMSLKCSGLYLHQFRVTSPHLLASGDGTKSATIVGDVYIHPSAKIHPTAKIGPNVPISANARVGEGARLINCIVLDDVEIKENAVVIHSIVGWKSPIGKGSRVQAEGDYNAILGITILGESVTVEDEVVVINSIVLPNMTLNLSVQEEIIL